MKNSTKILLLVFFVIVFTYGLIFWADNSAIRGIDYLSTTRDQEIDLAFDFAHALHMNDPRAYDMTDPNLKPRLDEWMNSHRSQKCENDELISSFIFDGTNLGDKIKFSCNTKTSFLIFEVDDIAIKDLKVIDWGEVRETDG